MYKLRGRTIEHYVSLTTHQTSRIWFQINYLTTMYYVRIILLTSINKWHFYKEYFSCNVILNNNVQCLYDDDLFEKGNNKMICNIFYICLINRIYLRFRVHIILQLSDQHIIIKQIYFWDSPIFNALHFLSISIFIALAV